MPWWEKTWGFDAYLSSTWRITIGWMLEKLSMLSQKRRAIVTFLISVNCNEIKLIALGKNTGLCQQVVPRLRELCRQTRQKWYATAVTKFTEPGKHSFGDPCQCTVKFRKQSLTQPASKMVIRDGPQVFRTWFLKVPLFGLACSLLATWCFLFWRIAHNNLSFHQGHLLWYYILWLTNPRPIYTPPYITDVG